MKIAFGADLHLSERPPSARTEQYADHLFAKIEEIQEICRVEGVDLWIEGGDRHHWPRPDRTPHSLVRREIESERRWPCPVRRIRGNHDGEDAGYERSALSVLMEALGDGEHSNAMLTENEWFQHDGLQVVVSPAHWHSEIDREEPRVTLASDVVRNGVDFVVKVAHALLMPPGSDPPFECTTFDQVPQEPQIDVMLFGHPHWQTKPQVVNGCLFVGPGSLARVARTEANHKPSIALLTLEKGKAPSVEYRELRNVVPAEEAFVDLAPEREEEGDLFAGYVGMLEAQSHVALDPYEALRALERTANREVLALARRFLNEAGGA